MSSGGPLLPSTHPDLEWAASGVMALTGRAEGPPRLATAPVAPAARGAITALAGVASVSPVLDASALSMVDGPALLGERAAIFGHSRHGSTSVGETCHLLRCTDGWVAVNLARPEDTSLLPAWLGEGTVDDPHAFVAARLPDRPTAAVVERARLLGLPVAPVAVAGGESSARWLHVTARGTARSSAATTPPRVVDLSSLWAGPLCAHLLALAGARVIKIESIRRPDGARRGAQAFFDLMNGGKRSVALDFTTSDGVRALRAVLEHADIVVESSRPRALRQLGIDAEKWVAAAPARVWVSITGYGREEPMAGWVAFGDDAAAAGGLVESSDGLDAAPIFCGDAIADPLTGMHAALAALAHWQRGEGALLDVALQRVAAFVAAQSVGATRGQVRASVGESDTRRWEVVVGNDSCTVAAPRARAVTTPAPQLGADTHGVLRELDIAC